MCRFLRTREQYNQLTDEGRIARQVDGFYFFINHDLTITLEYF